MVATRKGDDLIEGVEVCERCLKQHVTPWGKPSCQAHRAQRDQLGRLVPCGNPPNRFLHNCRKHGGNTPGAQSKARAAAVAEAQREDLAKVAKLFGVPRAVDPADGLIEAYWRSAGIIAQLEPIVANLSISDVVMGVVSDVRKTEHLVGVLDPNTGKIQRPQEVERRVTRAPRTHALVKLFNEERDRFERLGLEIVRLNLEVRRDEYLRNQVDAFAGIIARLDLSDAQRVALASALREIDGRTRTIEGTVA